MGNRNVVNIGLIVVGIANIVLGIVASNIFTILVGCMALLSASQSRTINELIEENRYLREQLYK